MVKFVAIDTSEVRALQAGGPDANGHPAERHIAGAGGTPCRHCFQQVAPGDPYLIVAHRPFPEPQPYAEQGPVFLHADACTPSPENGEIPKMLISPEYMIRGYSADNRIVYGTGTVVPTGELTAAAEKIFENQDVAYAHIRSAENNCYQCRVERG